MAVKEPKETMLWQNLAWRVVDRTIDSTQVRIDVEGRRGDAWEKRMPGSVGGTDALCMTIQHWYNRAVAAETALKRFETRGESEPAVEAPKKREHASSTSEIES